MLIAVVPQVVQTTGAEDSAELVQDGMCMAAQAIETLENQGKELMPRSVASRSHRRANILSGRLRPSCGFYSIVAHRGKYQTRRRVF
jgi:hypothetical protein